MKPWFSVSTPITRRSWREVVMACVSDSSFTPTTASSRTARLGCVATTLCIRSVYSRLSHCARVACTAGPRLVLSVFSCSEVRSALNPISPPSASSSNTRWLFASPPIEGLHGICAMESGRLVMRSVRTPMRAAMRAASAPACPPPTTMMSYLSSMPISISKPMYGGEVVFETTCLRTSSSCFFSSCSCCFQFQIRPSENGDAA